MGTIYVNTENIKANDPRRFVALQNLFITREKL